MQEMKGSEIHHQSEEIHLRPDSPSTSFSDMAAADMLSFFWLKSTYQLIEEAYGVNFEYI